MAQILNHESSILTKALETGIVQAVAVCVPLKLCCIKWKSNLIKGIPGLVSKYFEPYIILSGG